MEYAIIYRKGFSANQKKIQCENIDNALKLASELASFGYIIILISRIV